MSNALLLTRATLIDGLGGPPVPDAAVLIEGKAIAYAGPMAALDEAHDCARIDCTGQTVLPGLIEGHAHVGGDPAAIRTLRVSLQRGITTICSVSANLDGIRLRNAINEGYVRGAARMIAGCIVTPTHGHVKFRTADGPWEVRKAVREMAEAGADFIKTAASGGFWAKNESCSSPNYTLEELAALTDEAHAWGLPVAAHVHTQPGLGNCITTGVDMIHHGAFIDEAAVRGVRERDMFYLPTLAVTCQRNIDALSDQPWQTEEMTLAQPGHRAGVRLAHQLGVKLGVGTDYPGTPRTWRLGDRTLYELQELVACGLSPLEALTAATQVNAAAYRKLSSLGTLEPGKLADVLVVSGDPATDVSLLYDQRNLRLVLKEGRVEYADDAHRQCYRIADE